eukprot:TRINITY_DN5606_c0_g1_i10.p3 TRINITY_DN5606_c0_g1~~TRINITY_DN5606_c0_g1_i10.p3  ORF type:complete len:102 (+),score=2.39 TRINITY_DN5606_c0_g1_i10:133-438(+)
MRGKRLLLFQKSIIILNIGQKNQVSDSYDLLFGWLGLAKKVEMSKVQFQSENCIKFVYVIVDFVKFCESCLMMVFLLLYCNQKWSSGRIKMKLYQIILQVQ